MEHSKEYLIKLLSENKTNIILGMILGCLAALLNLKSAGIKDSVSLLFAVALLVNEIYLLIKRENKKSIILFLVSFPFLVTARKFIQIDILIFKITFESIYVTLLFLLNFKTIYYNIKKQFVNGRKSSFVMYLYLLIFIILVYNANTYSVYIKKSLGDTYIGVVIPIMFMLSVIALMRKEDEKNIIYALIANINISCMYGFLQIFKDGISLRSISANRMALTFGYHNVNIFCGILITVFPFVLNYILYSKEKMNKKEKAFIYGSFLIQGVALAISYTRGAWLIGLLAVFATLISKKYKKLVIAMMILGVIFLQPTMSFILTRGNSVESFIHNESAIARIQSISTDTLIMREYPFGVGMSSFPEYYKEFAVRGYLNMPDKLRLNVDAAHYMLEHAHNLILQIGVEFGVLALIIYLALIFNRLKVTLKNYSENRPYFVSIICYICFSVVTGNEFNHKGVITGTLVIFLVMALVQIKSEESLYE
ncbi:MAG: O-antigen ligase family protein [Clostridium sp.]